MKFFKTKLLDGEVNVLFTGQNYFFFHGFHGVICIAERDVEQELSNNSADNWLTKFTLYSGHRGVKIEKDAFVLAKKIITKNERKHVPKTVEFEEKIVDLAKCHVEVSYDLNYFG